MLVGLFRVCDVIHMIDAACCSVSPFVLFYFLRLFVHMFFCCKSRIQFNKNITTQPLPTNGTFESTEENKLRDQLGRQTQKLLVNIMC